MFAAKQGNLAAVRTLVENGRADVNLWENVSLSLLHACMRTLIGNFHNKLAMWMDSSILCPGGYSEPEPRSAGLLAEEWAGKCLVQRYGMQL